MGVRRTDLVAALKLLKTTVERGKDASEVGKSILLGEQASSVLVRGANIDHEVEVRVPFDAIGLRGVPAFRGVRVPWYALSKIIEAAGKKKTDAVELAVNDGKLEIVVG